MHIQAKWFLNSIIIFGIINILFLEEVEAQRQGGALYLNETAPIEERVEDLLSRMTLQEKVGQMVQYNGSWDVTGPAPEGGGNLDKYERIKAGRVGSMLNVVSAEATREAQELAVENSRLGIPLLFGYDVIHGYRTMMPVPLGETASWEPELWERSARIAAKEAAAAGIHWTFAPMIDVTRDARWGRIMESPGEDPYLSSVASRARVRGFQGDDLSDPSTIAATAKHFAGYGFSEAGRDYNTVDMSMFRMHNIVLPPFKAAADAGVASFMNAFNIIHGTPATASRLLQRHILKDDWQFNGFVVSDWGSIKELIDHGYARDLKDAALKAVEAGSDMDMESYAYQGNLIELVQQGILDEDVIDDAAGRILTIKFKLGLFEDPYRYSNTKREERVVYSKEHRAAARDIARKSIVLLKNEQNILPLSKSNTQIGVIGSLAESKDVPLGSWRAQAETNSAVSLLEGIKEAAGRGTNIRYAPGYQLTTGERNFITELEIVEGDTSGFGEAVEVAKESDVVIVAVGEDAWQSGEARSQVDIGLKGDQIALLKRITSVNDKVVVVLMNGRPLTINWVDNHIPGILETWHLGSEAGNAIADVLFGEYNPSGKLPVTFPRSVGQIPIYYNHFSTGRPVNDEGNVFWSHYTDSPNSPLYPFGFGLSYTSFQYADIALNKMSITQNDTLTVSITITNTGQRAGEEVVQCYIQDLVATPVRPVKELKDFQKISLEPGERKKVTFTLTDEDLKFHNGDKWVIQPGRFKVFIGGNSRDVHQAGFTLR